MSAQYKLCKQGMAQSYLADVQVYFGKSSPKINHLRVDSLAMLLSLANIGSHGKVRLGIVKEPRKKRQDGDGIVHLSCTCGSSSKVSPGLYSSNK